MAWIVPSFLKICRHRAIAIMYIFCLFHVAWNSPSPTIAPTSLPSSLPTSLPSNQPSNQPSRRPSRQPTSQPSRQPSSKPTAPTAAPTTGYSSETDPVLQSFKFDSSSGIITLGFSEYVAARTMTISKMTLQSSKKLTTNTTVFKLTTSYNSLSDQGNVTQLLIYLTRYDYARLKVFYPGVCSSNKTTFLTLNRGAVYSRYGHPAFVYNTSHAFQVTTFLADKIGPSLTNYSLDMNEGTLTMTFNKPLDISSFTVSGLAVQPIENTGSERYDLIDSGWRVTSNDTLRRTLAISLGTTNLNYIKAVPGLCRSAATTFLSAWAPFVNDTANNKVSIAGFDSYSGVSPTLFVPDTTPSILWYWDFDFSTGILSLYFDETVNIPFFNYSAIAFTDTKNHDYNSSSVSSTNATIIRLEKPPDPPSAYSPNLVLTLGSDELNLIKIQKHLFKFAEFAYLVLDRGACTDTSTAENVYEGLDATFAHAMQVRTLTPDTVSPQISTFAIDMTLQLLTLSFTEIIDIGTFKPSAITLQSKMSSEEYSVTLTDEITSVLTKNSSVVVEVQLSARAFSKIKVWHSLCLSKVTCYISSTAKLVKDLAGSPNSASVIHYFSALEVGSYMPDKVRPELVSFGVHMGHDVLIMNFTEPMNTSTLLITDIVLRSDADITGATTIVRLSSSSYVSRYALNTVYIQLGANDSSRIKSAPPFCQSVDTCFLTHTTALGYDVMTFNGTEEFQNAVRPNHVMQASLIIVDNVRPVLSYFSIDMNLGEIHLTFSEPVQGQEVNMTDITLYSSLTASSGDSYTLSEDSYCGQTYATNLTIVMSRYDYFQVKVKGIATGLGESWLDLAGGAVKDVAGNLLGRSSSLTGAYTFVPDTTAPAISAFVYDRSSRNLTVYFNDVIDVKTSGGIDLSSFKVYSDQLGKEVSLSDCTIVSTQNTHALLLKVTDSMKTVFTTYYIGTTLQSSTYMYLSNADVVLDIPEGNGNKRMTSSQSIMEGNSIVRFRLNMAARNVIFEFAYYYSPLDWTIDATGITIKNTAGNEYYKLTGYAGYNASTRAVFYLEMLASDHSNIQSTIIMPATSYVKASVAKTAFKEVADWDSTKATFTLSATTQTLSCALLLKDRAPPSLASFSVDLNLGTLTIVFSETVDLTTLYYGSLVLVNAKNNYAASINLYNGTLKSSVGLLATASSIVVSLLGTGAFPTERDRIHLSKAICSSVSTCYIIIEKGFVADMAGNWITPTARNATKAVSLIADTTSPKLNSFNFDANNRLLRMYFSVAMNASLTKTSSFALLSNPASSSPAYYYLSTSTISYNYSHGDSVVLSLSEGDYNSIFRKAPNLCLSSSNCYLASSQGGARDIAYAKNTITTTYFRFGLQVNLYTENTRAPSMTSFNVSMQAGYILIYFDTVVNCSATVQTNIILQYSAFCGSSDQTYTLNTSRPDCSTNYDNKLYIPFDTNTLNTVKAFTLLFKSSPYTYLRFESGAFFSAAGNVPNAGILDGRAVPVQHFIPDTVQPILQSFTVSAQGVLTLYFDEPVDPTTLTMTSIHFLTSASVGTVYSLTTASTVSLTASHKTIVSLAILTDFTRISAITSIFKLQGSTYLTIDSTAIKDMSRNYVQNISASSALLAGPAILMWDLDMNDGKFTLYFSEAVNGSFTPEGMGVQRSGYSDYATVTFSTAGYFVPYGSQLTYVGHITNYDLTRMKYLGLGNSSAQTFLTSPYGLTKSLSTSSFVANLKVVPVTQTNALAVHKLTLDTTPPHCLFFDLNLGTDQLWLTFNKPVLASTLDLTAITLLSSTTGSSVTLADTTSTYLLTNMTMVEINITRSDMDRIKLATLDGAVCESAPCNITSELNAMVLGDKAIRDFSGNYLSGNSFDSLIEVRKYTADTLAPKLTYTSLDVDTGVIVLFFDEIVQYTSLSPTGVRIYSSDRVNESSSSSSVVVFNLTEYSIVTLDSTDGSILVDMGILGFDLINLESYGNIATSANDTYFSVVGVRDLFGNKAEHSKLHQVSKFYPSAADPVLRSFDYLKISNTGGKEYVKIGAYFSASINITSFRCRDLILQSDATTTSSEVRTLTDSECHVITKEDSANIFYRVNDSSLNVSLIGSSESSTYMSIPTTRTTVSAYGHLLNSVSAINALRVGPQVVKFVFDADTGYIVLIFSRVVKRTGFFNVSCIGFYSSGTSNSYYLADQSTTLGAYTTTSADNDTIAVLTLSLTDLNAIKWLSVSSSTMNLLIRQDALYDTDGQSLAPKTTSNMLLVSRFFPDVTAPAIVRITVDLGQSYIKLEMDEPILQSSVQIVNFEIQDSQYSTVNATKLTGGSVTESTNGEIVYLNLSIADGATIKLSRYLAKSLNSTFISCAYRSLTDMAGNYLPIIKSTAARQINVLVADKVGPIMLSFTLDMTLDLLVVNYNEPIQPAAFSPTYITIQSRYARNAGVYYTLTGGNFTVSDDQLQVTVVLTKTDTHNIKFTNGLARRKQSTYLTAASNTTKDLDGNWMQPVIDGFALLCSSFTFDSKAPTLERATINVNDYSIVLYFSDLIEFASIDVTAITLQNGPSSYVYSAALTTGSKAHQLALFQSVVPINVSASDMNTLKALYPLISSINDTWFSMQPSFAGSVFGISVSTVSTSNALEASEWYPDIVRPHLLSYTFDMQSLIILFTFSEAISLQHLKLSKLTVQSETVQLYANYSNLKGSLAVVGSGSNSIEMNITIDSMLSIVMKYKYIANQLDTAYISYSNTFVSDYSGNFLPPLWDGSVVGYTPRLPDVYISDTEPPYIIRWYLDRVNLRVHIMMNEPVHLMNRSTIKLYYGKSSRTTLGSFFLNDTNPQSTNYSTEFIFKYPEQSCYLNSNTTLDICSLVSEPYLSGYLFLTMGAYSFEDFALVPNTNAAIDKSSMVKEGNPDCSLCPSGYYVSTNCTSHSDRVCSICKSCGQGKYYIGTACASYSDAACGICKDCKFGSYVSTVCGGTQPTVCSSCTPCGSLEYEVTPCSLGQNTICASCEKCSFTSATVAAVCQSTEAYFTWMRSHCCYDYTNTIVPCDELSLANMKIETLSGRHQWVFADAVPNVGNSLQYALGQTYTI